MPGHGPADPSPAVDFLATIQAKERIPGGAAAFAVLDDAGRATLESLLGSYHDQGLTATLERRARTFLISYREIDKHAGVLDAMERAQLDQILDEPPGSPRVRPAPRGRGMPWRWAGAALAVCLTIGLSVGVDSYVSSPQSGPPPAAGGPHPPGQPVPPGATDLQNLKQDYGPWQQLTPSDQRPQTRSPALLLLEDGACFASGQWTVSPGAPGWQPDAGGNVAAVNVSGDHADITDADGNPYIVGINQPFVISSNPGTVLLIDRGGTVMSVSLAQATAVRHSLRKQAGG
jgi:hypothetical protein